MWKDDKDHAYDEFMSKNPSLDHYEAKLKTFSATEDEISAGQKLSITLAVMARSANGACRRTLPVARTFSVPTFTRCRHSFRYPVKKKRTHPLSNR